MSSNTSTLYYYLGKMVSEFTGVPITDIKKEDFKQSDMPSEKIIFQKFKESSNTFKPLDVSTCTSITDSLTHFDKLILIRALIFSSLSYEYNSDIRKIYQETAYNLLISTIEKINNFDETIKVFKFEASKKQHPFFYELFISNGYNHFTYLCKKNNSIMKIINKLWYDTGYTDIYADTGYEVRIQNEETKKWITTISYTRCLDIRAKTNWPQEFYNKWIYYMENFDYK